VLTAIYFSCYYAKLLAMVNLQHKVSQCPQRCCITSYGQSCAGGI